MTNARYAHTASILTNGKVLVTGGYNNIGGYLNSAELYDPSTGNWKTTGNMTNARYAHTASVLTNGKVLVTGGWNGSVYLNSAELY
jgi:N-acetylneuraminic acid mutarotase